MTPDFATSLSGLVQAHAAPLLTVAPILAAAVCALLPNGRAAWAWSVLVTGVSLFFALVLAAQVGGTGVISYELGGWAPPIGIEFRVDPLNIFLLVLVAALGLLSAIFALPTVEAEIAEEKRSLFYSAYLLCFAGLLGVSITGDAFNLFVFLEISSISTYVLVALGGTKDRRALPAAFDYLVMGTIGATFFVIGVGFLYAATGTLNMADLAERARALPDSRTIQAGFAFIVVGLGLKFAMWPLHQWLPPAYTYAPSFVTAFLSATATKVALYGLIRMLYSVFDPSTGYAQTTFSFLFAPVAAVAVILCSAQAFFQTDVRRMLAYSSVAQIGYMLIGVALGTMAGLAAGLLHLINHALMKGALFMAVAGVALYMKAPTVAAFAGLGKRAPWTMAAFTIAGLSLIGVPLTAGFVGKWALLQATLDAGWYWAAAIIAVGSLVAVLYMGRILEAVWFRAASEEAAEVREAPLLVLLPLWALALANIYFGLEASLTVGAAEAAAASVFGGAR